MGVPAKAVARLEEKVESVRELRKIAEQLDTKIVARMEESEGIGAETSPSMATSPTRSPGTTT